MADKCFFNGCDNECAAGAWKCEFHKNRVRCRGNDCRNQVYARYLCVRHGGKKKCQFPDCTGNARVGTYCCRHGAASKKKHCMIEGCTKVAHARRLCVGHGGGRICKVEGCTAHARHAGCCRKHGRDAVSANATDTESPNITMLKEEILPLPLLNLYPMSMSKSLLDQPCHFSFAGGDFSPIDVLDFDVAFDADDLDGLFDAAVFDCPWTL
ncbi:hypothetical protein H310_05561 [Aphanomyces invadans]|uniref:WRKY transcription factor 19 n=1 Tax=Aphanomyces invadans TaxID=157072 RepID=A0A024UB62_9STRA|nr:hypothetical protein H310_05561 [Aphanomyces invadans]ETW03142.1 hypothetical protein H310_05561 [Aphanomyces invadans]RHY34668.1 hypothetical protein DYB32_000743 [Aphanomyces invadans]|eukprot:XP_008868526.1 hypothetical protein H310_05561 [Aphanomyces invadans]